MISPSVRIQRAVNGYVVDFFTSISVDQTEVFVSWAEVVERLRQFFSEPETFNKCPECPQ